MRWMVVAGVVMASASPARGWAKQNPNWHTPKCAPTNDPGKICTHDPGAKITAIVAVDQKQVVLVEPDPLIVCAGDTVVWILINACDEKKGCNAKKIEIYGPGSMSNVFKDCVLGEKTLNAGEVNYTSTCTVVASPAPGIYKYDIKGTHACDPEVDVREGTDKTKTTTTTTTTIPAVRGH